MSEPEAFYLRHEGGFVATELTRGPWAPDAQHGGPPAALLVTELLRRHRRDGMTMSRVTVEILGPVPLGPLTVSTSVLRPGRGVELLGATVAAGGRDVLRGQAWLVRSIDTELPSDLPHPADPPPLPPADGGALYPSAYDVGYHTGMAWRSVRGSFSELGPASVWMRMRHPLVAGEDIEPVARAVIAADCGNGLSGVLDFARWHFVNPDLTVYLTRPPVGEWVHLDASTTVEAGGVGLAQSALSDERGPVGRGLQSLYVAPRRSV
ncbi:MAG: thioesterase family protein [Actinomycetota bacterium]|nr:thioesterase family protein [Actinomycetota bacterium]